MLKKYFRRLREKSVFNIPVLFIILTLFIILFFVFIYPKIIRRHCFLSSYDWAIEKTSKGQYENELLSILTFTEIRYKGCLLKFGLKPEKIGFLNLK